LRSYFLFFQRKLSNLLVTHDFHVRVADFGLTRIKDKKGADSAAPQGSPAYMAPEVFMGTYDEKCDVYSFGMCLWEMLTQVAWKLTDHPPN
jgi:serine/threonine protein kinase